MGIYSWEVWLRGVDLNHRPLGYEPNELPDCSTPRSHHKQPDHERQTVAITKICDIQTPEIALP